MKFITYFMMIYVRMCRGFGETAEIKWVTKDEAQGLFGTKMRRSY